MKAIFRPKPLIRTVPLDVSDKDPQIRSRSGLYTEWLITNGLGGYASGTVGGINTRRFHGWLIAALPAPHGRTMMANSLLERFYIGDKCFKLSLEDFVQPHEVTDDTQPESGAPTADPVVPAKDPVSPYLDSFRLETGLPVWTFKMDDVVLEKRVTIVHLQNTTHITYTLLQGSGRLEVRPALHVRPHEGALEGPSHANYRFAAVDQGFELCVSQDLPTLKFAWEGDQSGFHMGAKQITNLRYRIEQSRGYDWQGGLWSPGTFTVELSVDSPASLTLSTEDWDKVQALPADQALPVELERRRRLMHMAPEQEREDFGAELVLAADQFLITPIGRTADQVRAHAVGDQIRSVIAGYHWFTDWGRDTMISLEGLTLSTGRCREAEFILRSFSNYIRHGLIPNLFPEGKTSGLYHTADATMWFFHAVDRYYTITGDIETLEYLLPKLVDVLHWHLRGTDFGIRVDPSDGLLTQGAIGYQLTWMDAKVGNWVVTPRRGKAVEINALWYNALRLTCDWLSLLGNQNGDASLFKKQADLAYDSFQKRFWNPKLNCLFDVVDSPEEKDGQLVNPKNDPSIRPNQVIAFALRYPVLAEDKWKPVLQVVKDQLLTPVGLRSLAPTDPNYKARYDGDLQTRDAAYHQGTVWAWLIGPFCNAWLRTYPGDIPSIHKFLSGFREHLYEDGVGTISEIFDAEPPFTPRGCMAQAWSVAEVLRCKLMADTATPL
ncbi:MAG: glycogen debranching enzyme family protein [Acidobacteria bacterium]|nr:glycogen debranching enzyme family protein [Acidobacteriota bacterium]